MLEHLALNQLNELESIIYAISKTTIIAATDTSGTITFVNDKFCEISKYKKEELIGQNHSILKSGHHSERFHAELWKSITRGKTWSGEIKNRAKDGSYFWFFTTITPPHEETQNSQFYIAISFDITAKKKLEEKMNMLKIELDQAMIEREIREQFLQGLSHDLKTPLTIAKISAQIIAKKDFVTDKIKRLSAKITTNIDRVDDLINGLLDANRNKKQQHLSLDFTELSMLDIVTTTIENLSTIHGNRFTLKADGQYLGYWYQLGIQRIIENLANNAVKYGDINTPINISISENDNKIILSVHNMGPPISEADQQIIFNYLQRTNEAELSDKEGWGVGLTIVKGMAEVHGGSVKVFSHKDEGTTFTVVLPKDSRNDYANSNHKNETLVLANECENFIRLFRHMPEIQIILTGPTHIFDFVNEAFVETFGFNATGMSVHALGPIGKSNLAILDQVYATGFPQKIVKNPIMIGNKVRYFNQTFVPRKNSSGDIIGILAISSEVDF